MVNIRVTASLISCLAVCVVQASGDSPKEIATRFMAKTKEAMISKDLTFFIKNSTDDFTYVTSTGQKTSKKASIEGMKAGFAMMGPFKKYETKLVSAKQAQGGIVYVTDEEVIHPMKMNGKTSTLASTMRNETLLVKKDGKWVYKRVSVLKENTTLDGKPMNGM